MRPVNLIPKDERRGGQAPLRTGLLAYFVVGALVAVLAGVTALVLTGNQVSEREEELAQLRSEDAAASVEARRLSVYTQFQTLSRQRVATVQSLADSRFDWERVMRELSLILPSNVWLIDLTATVAPGVSVGDAGGGSGSGSGGDLRGSIPGPAMELSGCAAGQEAVAGFVTALKDIDGVTRVGVQSSQLPDEESGAGVSEGGDAGSGSAGDDCRTRSFIAKFEIIVAFDAAPVPITASSEGAVTEAASSESGEGSEDSESSEGAEGS